MEHIKEFCIEGIESALVTLKKFGIAVIPNFLEKSDVSALNFEFDGCFSNAGRSIFREKHPINEEGQTARLNPLRADVREQFPKICTVFQHQFMRDVSSAYFAPHSVSFNDEVFVTHELPSERPILPWHFDRMQSLKFWFYLTDTTKENGAFEYCPGTHWEGRYRASYYLAKGLGIEELPNDIDEELIRKPITLALRAGDLLIFDADGFHRGGIVSEGRERRVLRAHTHPIRGRRFGDKLLSSGWWISSWLNINRWLPKASERVIGERIRERSVNRKKR